MEVHLIIQALPEAVAEHGLEIPAGGSQHCPMARERPVPCPKGDISEHAVLPQRVQVGQDTVWVGGLVKKQDVHGAGAGAGFTVLVDADRHGGQDLACRETNRETIIPLSSLI